jgi:hypothetical protein
MPVLKKTKRKFKRGGSRVSKKSKRPSPIMQPTAEQLLVSNTKNSVLEILDNMKRDEIMSLFFPKINIVYEAVEIDKKFITDNFENYSEADIISDKDLEDLKKRNITKIISIQIEGSDKKTFKNLYFFKSSGSSRPEANIKGIYFPINYLPSDDEKIYLFQKEHTGIRIKKPEDHYKKKYKLMSLSSYTKTELKELKDESKELLKYGRFINKDNAIISHYLSLLKCN